MKHITWDRRLWWNTALRAVFAVFFLYSLFFILQVVTVFAQTDSTTLSQTILSSAECGDTIDNDGDTLIDFPADPDCTSLLDNSESPPPPSGGSNRPPLPTLEARLEAFPTIGIAPLEGVDLQVWTLGFARGPINYTFYCDWDDPTTVVAPPWDAKADGVFFNPYIATDTCAYEAPGLYTAKVIVERGNLVVSAFTAVEVLWSSVPIPEPEPIPTPEPTPEPEPGAPFSPTPTSESAPPSGATLEPAPTPAPEPVLPPEPTPTQEPTPEPEPDSSFGMTIPLLGNKIILRIPIGFDFPLMILLWILLIVSIIFAWLVYKSRRLR